jgi:hypothetical protein
MVVVSRNYYRRTTVKAELLTIWHAIRMIVVVNVKLLLPCLRIKKATRQYSLPFLIHLVLAVMRKYLTLPSGSKCFTNEKNQEEQAPCPLVSSEDEE